MSGESMCMCGRDLALMCRACDADVCDECLQLPKARAEIARLRDELASCIQFAAEGWTYASPYFAEKWEYGKRMAGFALAIERPRPTAAKPKEPT